MEQLINLIIRPPRAVYDPNNDLLDEEFMLKGKWFQRKDIEIINSRGDVLKCSHYLPIVSPAGKPLPCVIYCHGNSGCRVDASEVAIILLPSNITVFTLDFSGSGLSGGEHVSQGWYEKDDLKSVVDYLRSDGNVSLIALWGRSMGAVTSLMYGVEDSSIAGMVLDSPFSDLVDSMMEHVDAYKIPLPKFGVKFAIQYMRRAILKKAKFDIVELNTVKVAKSSFVPALFGHATDDDFIHPHHSDRIYEAYMGDKNIINFEGDHDSPRPQFYFDSINIFFHNVLHPPEDEVKGNFFDSSLDYLGKEIHGVGYEDDFLVAPQASSSTEEAINKLRSKRPMSRTEVPSDIPSTDKQCNSEDEATSTEHTSSSKVINFEFSNGHSYKPSLEDNHECVEYRLQHIEGLQCNVEEEERMLMEAVKQNSHIMAFLQELDHLKIPFEDIKSATNNFAHQNLIGEGGFGPVYKGQLPSTGSGTTVAVKRLDVKRGQGEREFLMEIAMLVSYKHDNLVSLVGFSDQGNEKLLVYKHEDNGSLDTHLDSKTLTWEQRLRICGGAARGLEYLHNGVGIGHRVIHRDIKSSNILLDANWEAKVSDFGLSKIGPANQQFTFLVTNACGTLGYLDPQYYSTGVLTKESDVYSFGIVLFEVLCGRVALIMKFEDERKFISGLVKFHQQKGTLHDIILPNLLKQIKPGSLEKFTEIAFQCLNDDRKQRPPMDLIVKDLEIALDHQLIEGLPCNVEEEERMLMEAVLLSLQDKPQR